MKYRELRKYKYQLTTNESVNVNIDHDTSNEFIFLNSGKLVVKEGYAWDGATCAPDRPTIMKASLFHDALYQLMREGKLNRDKYRVIADKLLKKVCLENGMSRWRAEIVYRAVRIFGRKSTLPTKDNKVITI